jgi:4-hydroxy-4-methyl-2-oxoglutarate aldolase
VPKAIAAAVADKSEARVANEDEKRKRLAAGELGLDIYNMRPALEKAGLVYADHGAEERE